MKKIKTKKKVVKAVKAAGIKRCDSLAKIVGLIITRRPFEYYVIHHPMMKIYEDNELMKTGLFSSKMKNEIEAWLLGYSEGVAVKNAIDTMKVSTENVIKKMRGAR